MSFQSDFQCRDSYFFFFGNYFLLLPKFLKRFRRFFLKSRRLFYIFPKVSANENAIPLRMFFQGLSQNMLNFILFYAFEIFKKKSRLFSKNTSQQKLLKIIGIPLWRLRFSINDYTKNFSSKPIRNFAKRSSKTISWSITNLLRH